MRIEPPPMEIRSLADTGLETLYAAFAEAFADYEMQLNQEQLQRMLRRRGFVAELSFAAFDRERIVAFTLNGIGEYDGIPTAYDTGTGTLAAYRGQGLATRIFEHSIPHLKRANVSRYLLEVLQHNTKAVSVYRRLGFEVTREFNYFSQETPRIACRAANPDFSYSVRRIDIARYGPLERYWDFRPSWQNSPESVARASADLVALGLFAGEELAGYGVFEPGSGDVAQIGVAAEYRRRGVGSVLLREMRGLSSSGCVKVVNTDAVCAGITSFLENCNIPLRGKQFEMIRTL